MFKNTNCHSQNAYVTQVSEGTTSASLQHLLRPNMNPRTFQSQIFPCGLAVSLISFFNDVCQTKNKGSMLHTL